MNNHLANILAILSFFWPYGLLVASFAAGVMANDRPWIGAIGMVVAIWTLSFRELRHM